MSSTTGIEWTDATWNPTVGCSKVSEGCRNCYAMRMAARIAGAADAIVRKGGDPGPKRAAYAKVVQRARVPGGITRPDEDHLRRPLPQWNNQVECVEEALDQPLKWKTPKRIFVDSESDLFHGGVPFEFIDKVLAVAALCPRHTFQILTKRPERMAEYFGDKHAAGMSTRIGVAARELVGRTPMSVWEAGRTEQAVDFFDDHGGILPNVWLGTSIEDQATADKRIPQLLRCPAAVRFLSCEPLLGPVDLLRVPNTSPPMPGCPNGAPSRRIDWVIVGGESGPGARPCDVAWIRSIVEQCRGAGVPCFVKQLGAFAVYEHEVGTAKGGCPVALRLRDPKGGDPTEWPEDLRVREFPRAEAVPA